MNPSTPFSADLPGAPHFAGQGLACRRGGTAVFGGVSFSLSGGEALVLTGPNGAGKSSLLRLMAGLLAPAEGALLWNGEPVTDAPADHAGRVCYLGHADALKPAWSLSRNLGFLARLAGEKEAGTQIGDALDQMGLTALADVPVAHLSRGQARRGALARLLLVPRGLWLLDEPTASLDENASALVAGLIDRHCADGGLAVVATHRPLGLTAGGAALNLSQTGSVAAA